MISILIVLPFSRRVPKWALSFWFATQDFVLNSRISDACYMLRPHYSRLDHANIFLKSTRYEAAYSATFSILPIRANIPSSFHLLKEQYF